MALCNEARLGSKARDPVIRSQERHPLGQSDASVIMGTGDQGRRPRVGIRQGRARKKRLERGLMGVVDLEVTGPETITPGNFILS